MIDKQKEILRQKIYDSICYECSIELSKFSPDILLNYGEYELRGEFADMLTFETIPEALGIRPSYELPFANNLYFRDSGNPVIFIINLFKPKKDIRPPLTAKQYADLILSLYDEYQKVQAQEQKQTDALIQKIPPEKRKHLEKRLYLLLIQTLSITKDDYSPDMIINDGTYKLSGKKAKKFIKHSALCLDLPNDDVYNHFQEKEYFVLPTSMIAWIVIILFSPILIIVFMIMAILTVIYSLGLLINYFFSIISKKSKNFVNEKTISKNKQKPITANEYVYEMLGLWAKKNVKIDPFLVSMNE